MFGPKGLRGVCWGGTSLQEVEVAKVGVREDVVQDRGVGDAAVRASHLEGRNQITEGWRSLPRGQKPLLQARALTAAVTGNTKAASKLLATAARSLA